MRNAAHLITALLLLPAFQCQTDSTPPPTTAPAPATGSISGTIKIAGDLKRVRGPDDPVPGPGGRPIDASKLKSIRVGGGGTLANVYVTVKSGLGDRQFPTPSDPVLLRQVGYVHEPRILGLMTNQTLKVRNDDDTLHNIHIVPQINPPFNKGQKTKGVEDRFQFSKPEIGIAVKCDVHPWMRAWIHVSDHPYFAVTGIDGTYSLKDLPPGEYDILAWHERFREKPLIAKVKVESGKTATLDFTFEVPFRR